MAGLHQADLALRVGVSRPNISFWEHADYPPLEAIEKICNALGLEIGKFFANDFGIEKKNYLLDQYSTLFEEINQLDKENSDDLLSIMSIILTKFKRDSSQETPSQQLQYNTITIDQDDYRLHFISQNAGYIALGDYTERFLRIF